MPLTEPSWWYADGPTFGSRALSPLARLWGQAAQRRFMSANAVRVDVPVICIGNLTAGGTGKTPLALHIATRLAARGLGPAFLTRGYGGRLSGPHWVQPGHDRPDEVGDEPLLLARVAPTMVARDRVAGARAIVSDGRATGAIIMDDGLQNGSLGKDLVLAVVDGRRGIGNGYVLPAGPLRAPLDFQLGLVDAVIVNGAASPMVGATGEHAFVTWLRGHFGGPVLRCVTRPTGDTSWLREQAIVAYSGIGAPERFFSLLEALGARLVLRRAFPDHHVFTEREASALLREARDHDAILCTTEKDQARLAAAAGVVGELREASRVMAVRLELAERDDIRLDSLIEASLVARGASLS
ncbi:MAG: tetraacyldisaccharide 4'-kinase [Hyphomicrobiaceae bacterium]